MKLFRVFSRGHTPDIDALSALVDGALDATVTAELEAHIAGCGACAAELAGLQRVKSMLAALPQVAPERAFRVRQADIEAAPRTAGAPVGGLLRAMPALAAAAAFVFVAALATDFSTRDGDGERQASSGPAVADSAARSLEMEDATLSDGDDGFSAGAEATMQYARTPSAPAGAIAPEASGEQPADGSAGGGESAGDTAAPDTADAPPSGAPENAAPAPRPGQIEAIDADSTDDDDDGNRAAFVIVEVVAGAIALGALALFIYSRRSRSEGVA